MIFFSTQVAEYVLPKFAIDIELPDYGNLGEPTTRVVILVNFAITLITTKNVTNVLCQILVM